MVQSLMVSTPKQKLLPILCRGTTAIYVKQLQLRLQDLGAHVIADGLFDLDTETAVRKFQQQHGLTVDGIVGDQTWQTLLPILEVGSLGDEVKRLQIRLNFLISTHLIIDGLFGMRTQAAVKQFQARYVPTIDGVVNLQTWDALLHSVILSVDF